MTFRFLQITKKLSVKKSGRIKALNKSLYNQNIYKTNVIVYTVQYMFIFFICIYFVVVILFCYKNDRATCVSFFNLLCNSSFVRRSILICSKMIHIRLIAIRYDRLTGYSNQDIQFFAQYSIFFKSAFLMPQKARYFVDMFTNHNSKLNF